MANININIKEAPCEPPVFTTNVYTGNPYEFELGWESLGDVYSIADPNTEMTLQLEIWEAALPASISTYSIGVVNFNELSYVVNVLNYNDNFSQKFEARFTLTLTSTYCTQSEIVEFLEGSF